MFHHARKAWKIVATVMVRFVMITTRLILLSLACTLPIGAGAMAAPVVAQTTVGQTGVDVAQLTEPAGRKGTRNYRDGESTTPAPSDPATMKNDGLSTTDKLAQCMETWDTGTHITKAKWREICKRQLDDQ
jgi:hypothetical protein